MKNQDRKPIAMNILFAGYMAAYGLTGHSYRFEFEYNDEMVPSYKGEPHLVKYMTCKILDKDLNPVAIGRVGCYSGDRYIKWKGQMHAMANAMKQFKEKLSLTRVHRA